MNRKLYLERLRKVLTDFNETSGIKLTIKNVEIDIESYWEELAQMSESADELIDSLVELSTGKNQDYCLSDEDAFYNFNECNDFGIPTEVGIITRLSDKIARLRAIKEHESVNNESKKDNLMDLIVYSAILIIYMNRETIANNELDLTTDITL